MAESKPNPEGFWSSEPKTQTERERASERERERENGGRGWRSHNNKNKWIRIKRRRGRRKGGNIGEREREREREESGYDESMGAALSGDQHPSLRLQRSLFSPPSLPFRLSHHLYYQSVTFLSLPPFSLFTLIYSSITITIKTHAYINWVSWVFGLIQFRIFLYRAGEKRYQGSNVYPSQGPLLSF